MGPWLCRKLWVASGSSVAILSLLVKLRTKKKTEPDKRLEKLCEKERLQVVLLFPLELGSYGNREEHYYSSTNVPGDVPS